MFHKAPPTLKFISCCASAEASAEAKLLMAEYFASAEAEDCRFVRSLLEMNLFSEKKKIIEHSS